MKRSEAFPSKFLSKDDVTQPVQATIARVGHETLKSDDGDERKVVVTFAQADVKPLILNNTNWMALEDAYGDDSDNWIGRGIELYLDPAVMFGGKRVGGVRVRIPVYGAPALALDPRAEWTSFCKSNRVTEPELRQALGTVKVSEWLAAESGRTLEQAKAAVLAAMEAF